MKKILLLFLLLGPLYSNAFSAETAEKKINSEIKQVTVFLNGAQVERAGRANLSNGKTEIVFEKVSKNMNPQSLQVACSGSATIMDVRQEIYYEEVPKVETEFPIAVQDQIKQWNKEITLINSEIWYIGVERKLLQKEKSIIDTNPLLSGKTDSLPLLKEGMGYLHEKTLEIAKQEMILEKKLTELNEAIQEKREQINKLTTENTKDLETQKVAGQFYKVIVTVNASGPSNNEITLNYLVSDAKWVPAYDIRVESTSEPLKLAYKSQIYQNTGIDWEDVKLIVSTGNPSRNSNRPVLNPWYVQLQNPISNQSTVYGQSMLEKATLNTFAETDEAMSLDGVNIGTPPPIDLTATQVNELNVNYELTISHSIPSDRKWHTVQLKETEVEAEYEHHSVPKLDQAAYLLAKVEKWGALNLLPGQANLFAQGTYVGQVQINPQLISEYLLLSLGVDEKVGVKRYKLDSECNTAFISGKKTETYTWEIMLHNKKSETVTLSLLDQFPLAHQEAIEIELINQGGAEVTEEFGKLLWNLELGPNEIKKVQFTYSVKHPGDKRVAGI